MDWGQRYSNHCPNYTGRRYRFFSDSEPDNVKPCVVNLDEFYGGKSREVKQPRKEGKFMQKMRLISEAYNYIKEQDPDTCITKSGFARLVKEGRIPSIRIGNKIIVNLDNVERDRKSTRLNSSHS